MNNFQRLKGILTSSEVNFGRVKEAAKRRAGNLPHSLAWSMQAQAKDSSQSRLKGLHNKYAGERCFIIGNGPSLKQMDLSHLKNEFTFGLNRIYLMFDDIGFSTTFHVVMNELVLEQCADDIAKSPSLKFLNWNRRSLFQSQQDIIYFHQTYTPDFQTDLTKPIWGGATVTYASMQLAYYFGFKEVYLIGVDHSFSAKGTPHKVVTSTGDDADHFDPRYFGKGFRWQLPDLMTSEVAYSMAKNRFEKDGRSITDATVNGKLEIFKKADYYSLF